MALTLQRFETGAQAFELAKTTRYGLGSSIWSRDTDRPLRVAREVQAEPIGINDRAVLHDQFKEGGYMQGGQDRMRDLAAFDDFLEHKHIALSPGIAAAAQA